MSQKATKMLEEDVIRTLRALKGEFMLPYKVKEVRIFGSFARGEPQEGSDVDLLVDFEEGADFLDLVGLGQFLEERLQRKVDIVTKRALRADIREAVLKEAAAL